MQILGHNISKAAADAIVNEALLMAEQRGYCDDVESFLEDMGFTIPSYTKTVTLEVTVSGTGRSAEELGDYFNWTAYVAGDAETDSVKVVSVK